MSASIAEVVARLLKVRDQLAKAGVTALRAETDANEAYSRYEEASRGSAHRDIRAAVTNIQTAAQKSGKVARLLREAETHLAEFINTIAPGSTPDPPDVMPTGEELVAEAEARESRANRYFRKAVEAAANNEDGAKKAEQVITEAVSLIKGRIRPGDTHASVGVPTKSSPPIPQAAKTGHPVADATLAAVSVTVAVKAIMERVKRKRERKRPDGNQAPDS